MVSEPTVAQRFLLPSKNRLKNTESEFSLVLLQTTQPHHLNSAIQGLCQCA